VGDLDHESRDLAIGSTGKDLLITTLEMLSFMQSDKEVKCFLLWRRRELQIFRI
jgi:hypothetical protein